MFDKIRSSKLMFWSLELLILATLFFVATKISFIFQPVATFFSTLFAPVLVAGFLYYLFTPVVNFFVKRLKMKRILAIALVFVLLITAVVLIVVSIIPNLISQLASLAENAPAFVSDVEAWLTDVAKNPIFKDFDIQEYVDKLDISYSNILQKFIGGLSSSLGNIIGGVASTTMVILTAPFMLFYMMKDGDRLVPNIQRFFPAGRKEQIVDLLNQMNKTLSSYISGQAIECVFVGTFTFIGYLLVGVEYAFLFGMIAGVANLVPYLGPYIGLLPAVMVTVFNSPFQALLCCVVVLIVQQLDGNIIYPNVIGKSLQIHPLTIIVVLLVAGNIAGLLGIFLGVPFYAICRTVVVFIYRLIKEDQKKQSHELLTSDSQKPSE